MLDKAVPMVLVFGGVVGLLWPSHPPSPTRAARPAAEVAAPSDDAASAASAVARATDKSLDTVLTRAPDGHFYADAMVNDRLVHFMVDTGATSVALTKQDAINIGEQFSESDFQVVARGASGDVMGKETVLHHIAIGQKEAWDVRAAIIDDGLDVSLLGQNYLSQVGQVTIVGDTMTLR